MASTNNYTVKELKQQIRELGGKVTGTKAILQDRLQRLRTNTALDSDFPYGKGVHRDMPNTNCDEIPCDETCAICMDDINSNVYKTTCNHYFHQKCLYKWIKEKPSCPLCRNHISLKVDIERYRSIDRFDINILSKFTAELINLSHNLSADYHITDKFEDMKMRIINDFIKKYHKDTIKEMCKLYDFMKNLQ